jgi:hypothetical protein
MGTITRVDKGSFDLQHTFSMVSYLSSNIVSIVGWYVDRDALKHMTYDKKLFNKI